MSNEHENWQQPSELTSMDDLIPLELQARLELLEKASAYHEGYSDGLWWMWRGQRLVVMGLLVFVLLTWIATVIYTISVGC